MRDYISGWNFMRFIRLVLGVAIIIQGVNSKEWSFIIMGALFTLMPLFNVGCCAGNSCSTNSTTRYRHQPAKPQEETQYEEVR